MKLTKVFVCAWFVLVLAGCGSNSPVKETPEELYALGIKRRVRDVENAVRDPKEAQVRLSSMTEDLEMYEKRSAPEHKEVYKELQTIQKELLEDFKQSNSPANLSARVQKMKALADKLPGKIEPTSGGPNIPSAG